MKDLNFESMRKSGEVETIFTISLIDLLDPQKQEIKSFNPSHNNGPHAARMQLKVYTAHKYPVWGMTSYITEHILKEIEKTIK